MKYFLSLLVLIITACSPQNEQNTNFETKLEALASFQDTSTALADFGNPVTASTTRIFTFKNIGDSAGPGTPTLSGTNAASFSIVLQTGCATVNVGSTCTVRVNFNPSGKSIGTYNADLNVGGTIKSLSATVAAATTGGSTTGGTTSGSSGSIEATVSSVVIANPLDYGSFSGTQTSTKIIRLKNTGTTSTGPHTAALSDTDFSFTLNGCNNKTLAPNAYCDVRVTFNASGKTAQDYLTDLTFAGTTFPLKATVTASGGTTTGGASGGPVVSIAILEGTNPSADPLNYGTFSGTQSLTKILTVKNTGTSSVVVNPTLSDSSFKFVLNSCANKTLTPNGTCSVRVSFSASGQTSGVKNSTLTVHTSKTLALTAEVTGSSTIITYQLEYSSYGTCSAANACDGVGTQTRTATCRQLNNGIPGGTVPLSNCPAPASLTQSCDSPSGTAIVTTGLATGYSSQTVSCLEGQTTTSGTITDVSCALHYNKQGLTCEIERFSITVNKTKPYGDVTSGPLGLNCANVSSCSAQFDYGTEVTLHPSVSLGNGYAFGGFSGACNGTGTCVITVTADVTLDMNLVCEPDFHEDGNLCVPDVLTYTADYSDYGLCSADEACEGQGIQSRTITQCNRERNGNPDGTVDLSFCSAYNIPVYLDLSCDSPPGNKFVAISNGTKEVSCLSGSTIENFVGVSCDTLYHGEGELCLSDTRSCTTEELTAVDVDATAGTANWNSGTLTYDCTIDTCSASTHLVSASNLCDPNTVSCSDTAGGYFGVANGTKTWNDTNQSYGDCIPVNSSSCITGVLTHPTGFSYQYSYRTSSFFPAGEEEYPNYPYASGACLATELSCAEDITNALTAYRTTFSGENSQYEMCQLSECIAGYRATNAGTCVPREIYTIMTPTGANSGNHIYKIQATASDTNPTFTRVFPSTSYSNLGRVQVVSIYGTQYVFFTSQDNWYFFNADSPGTAATQITDGGNLLFNGIGTSRLVVSDTYVFFVMGNTGGGLGRELFRFNPTAAVTNPATNTGNSSSNPRALDSAAGSLNGVGSGPMLWSTLNGSVYLFGHINGSSGGSFMSSVNIFGMSYTNITGITSGNTASQNSFLPSSSQSARYLPGAGYFAFKTWNNNLGIIGSVSPSSSNFRIMNGINTTSGQVSSPSNFAELGGKIYFRATTSGSSTTSQHSIVELSNLTATTPSSRVVLNDVVGTTSSILTTNEDLHPAIVPFKGKLYFRLNVAAAGSELYSIDPTNLSATAEKVCDINSTTGGANPAALTVVGDYLYFVATSDVDGTEMYRTDGTSCVRISNENAAGNSFLISGPFGVTNMSVR